MHLAVDDGSGLVREAILTPAHVADKAPFLALVQGDEQVVVADKGYDGWWYRQAVERPFAVLKRWYGYARVRYRRLPRNALQLQLLYLAINLRRALVLTC